MTPPKKRCELDMVLNLLSIGFNKKEVRKKLNLKPSALSNHLRKLENLGCIERKGKYVVDVLRSSSLNPRVTKNQVHNKLNKRGHAFNFKIVFPKEGNLKERKEVKHEFELGNLKRLSFGSLRLTRDKNTIWINNNSLTIYSNNSYYSKNALHSKFRALKEIDTLVEDLIARFGFKGIYGLEVFREHYGLIFNKFAKWILKRGGKMYVKSKGDKAILWVDDSRKDDVGLKEFEGKDPITINVADKYFESHEKTGWKVTPSFLLEAINGVTKNQMIFDKNIIKHQRVLDEMSETLKLIQGSLTKK